MSPLGWNYYLWIAVWPVAAVVRIGAVAAAKDSRTCGCCQGWAGGSGGAE